MKTTFLIILVLFTVQASFAQKLPDFSFEDVNGNVINNQSLTANKPVIVFYFDPFCESCLEQAALISKEITAFKDITLLWVTTNADPENNAFKQKYFNNAKNVIVAVDTQYQFDTWFGYSEFNAIYCYNSKHEKTKSFNTTQTATTLLEAVK
ncbi:MAG TPA: redoxin family protein [Chitinophagales bacterium]|nr:redoxin family protein [Chitinophagales bacterium]HRG86611.1 redoxin family protein [Chitinophagales bacterium]